MDPPTYGSEMLSNIIFWNPFQKKNQFVFSEHNYSQV